MVDNVTGSEAKTFGEIALALANPLPEHPADAEKVRITVLETDVT